MAKSDTQSLLKRALDKLVYRRRLRLEKIVALTKVRGKITNNDVEKLLRVSDATATRYLSRLVGEGRLKRVGGRGRTHYEPI